MRILILPIGCCTGFGGTPFSAANVGLVLAITTPDTEDGIPPKPVQRPTGSRTRIHRKSSLYLYIFLHV
jgi:hypothetical protein